MKLNRTGSNWTELERNKINENWRIIEGNYNDVVDKVSEKALDKVVNSAKLNWKEPVDKYADLPSEASEGDTRMVRDSGKVYRFNGKVWQEIQQIDAGPVNELDARLTSQLENIEEEMFKSSLLLHKRTRTMFVWHDDDGHRGVYTKLAPLLREYGIVMSVAVITNRPHGFPIAGLPAYDPNDKYMSYEQMKELENEGLVEFIPHSHTHNINHRLTDMTIEEMHEELSTNKKIMKQLGWNHKDFVYPFGSFNDKVISVVRQYFRSAFKVSGGPLLTPFNQFAIDRIRVDAPATFEEIKEDIDKAFENNTLGVLTTHVDQYGGLDLQKMRQVIEYILSNGGEFVTTAEAINEFGNVLQVGSNSISHDGKITGKEIGVYREGGTDYEPNAPITEFPKGTVTRIRVRRTDLSPYGLLADSRRQGGYGVLETHRGYREDVYSYQLFINLENNTKQIRRWLDDQNKWGKWEDLSNVSYIKKSKNNYKPSEYPDLKTTIEKVRVDEAADYGLESAGILYTQKDIENLFTHQIFVPISSGITAYGMKVRNGTGNDSWTDWYTIPTSVNRYRRRWEQLHIPANSSYDRITSATSATVNSYYIDTVKTPLPDGINVQTYCWTNGTLVTRITNVTNQAIDIPVLEVDIKKIML